MTSATGAQARDVGQGRLMPPVVSVLGRTEALRFLQHPLYRLGAAACVLVVGLGIATRDGFGPDPLVVTMLSSFFLGVFGFAVAHRLTTSLHRTTELVTTAPVGRRTRTIALLLACGVPAATSVGWLALFSVYTLVEPPAGETTDASVAWFGDERAIDILAVLVAGGPLAALGGALLGVAVARWAAFRGSLLVGVVVLVLGTLSLSADSVPTRVKAMSPAVIFGDETVVDGTIVSARLIDGISPIGYCVYVACLCGLAAVAALLRDGSNVAALVKIGALIGAAAAAALALATW